MNEKKGHTVLISLARKSEDSQVFIDDVDITSAITCLEIKASMNEWSIVTLTLSCQTEIVGEAGKVYLKKVKP